MIDKVWAALITLALICPAPASAQLARGAVAETSAGHASAPLSLSAGVAVLAPPASVPSPARLEALSIQAAPAFPAASAVPVLAAASSAEPMPAPVQALAQTPRGASIPSAPAAASAAWIRASVDLLARPSVTAEEQRLAYDGGSTTGNEDAAADASGFRPSPRPSLPARASRAASALFVALGAAAAAHAATPHAAAHAAVQASQGHGNLIWLAAFAIVTAAYVYSLLRFKKPVPAYDAFGRELMGLSSDPQDQPKITFADIGGNKEAVDRVRKFVNYLKNPEKFDKLGDASSLRALLMDGPPGSGKTLMAEAIAGESGVELLVFSSNFVNQTVGSGAAGIRKMLSDAEAVVKKKGKVLVFIDEIEALAARRGGINSHSEHDNTLNEFLTVLNGFKKNKGIFFVGATNRKDMLDPAVLRGGRFGLQIKVDLPDVEGRADIFKKLIRRLKVRLSPDTDLDALALKFAKETSGLSGADIQHVLADAIVQEGNRDAEYVGEEQIFRSIEYREDGGELVKKLLPEERVMAAYHEAGHALGEHFLPYGRGVRKLTILGHGVGAEAFMRPDDDQRRYEFEAQMLDRMTIAMLGRAAEEFFSGRRYAGVAGDFPMARHYANEMVAHLGMSELGPRAADKNNPNDLSDATKRENEVAVHKLMAEALARAQALVREKADAAERLVEELLERETLRREEVIRILGPKAPQPRSPGTGESFKRLASAASLTPAP